MRVTNKGRSSLLWAAAVLAGPGLLAACSSPSTHSAAPSTSTSPPTVGTTTTTSSTTVPPSVPCPLTGLPAPGGKIPQRPALAIKVENLPEARPQYGLAQADIVYEEPVEGGITRFIAIYQCTDSSRVEPVRSGRWIDAELVNQYGAHPLFAYSGAVQPVINEIYSSALIDVGANRAPLSAYPRDPSRYEPHNLETSTQALYAYGASAGAGTTPPAPVFTYGAAPADATPAASATIPFTYSPVTWTWHPTDQLYYRSYSDTGPATLGGGGQITAANVVIMHLVPYQSSFVEDVNGNHETLLELTGSGPLTVVRSGVAVTGTWSRSSLSAVTQLLDAKGAVIPLAPGITWIELVPTNIPYTVTP
ncbi:MAG: DUF3048 domain-containing protein [Acidobacteriota bacterium]|nr:DUF3048 domain-containing protein [Acidobacteriota bacterium]